MRFGLLGAGTIGQIRARAIAGTAGLDLVAAYDVDAAAARALAGRHGAAAVTDPSELLRRDDIDAVIVSSPPQYHEEQALAALDAGKHVLCEKPLANSADAARRMVEAALDAGLVLTTGFNHRYFPAVRFVRETLESGLIGDLDHVRAFAGHPGLSEFRSASEHDPAVIGGGAMMDVGVHMTDLARHLLGDVEEVYGAASERVWHLDGAEDNALALFRSPAILELHLLMAQRLAGRAEHLQRPDHPPRIVRMNRRRRDGIDLHQPLVERRLADLL